MTQPRTSFDDLQRTPDNTFLTGFNRDSPDSPQFDLPGTFPRPLHQRSNLPRSEVSDVSMGATDVSSSVGSAGRKGTKVIRTFHEVEVEKITMAEEWYEELECGICSHVLGAPQALVPCGHCFCGTCAWQWIKTNKNYTCPHCRMDLNELTPFVPNIVVDQIIDRKLRSLPEGEQKIELLSERKEKADAWKSLQASIAPSKPHARRSRPFDDFLSFFEAPDPMDPSRRRRASRHLVELGAPLPQGVGILGHGPRRSGHILPNMSLGDIRRIEADEDAMAARMEARRLRELVRDQGPWLGALHEEPGVDEQLLAAAGFGGGVGGYAGLASFGGGNGRRDPPATFGGGGFRLGGASAAGTSGTGSTNRSRPSTDASSRNRSAQATGSNVDSVRFQSPEPIHAELPQASGSGNAQPGPSGSTRSRVQIVGNTGEGHGHSAHGRPSPLRSQALAARQARGRSRRGSAAAGGSRNDPLVVLSDSEED